MSDSVNQHKRMAMGQKVTGMARGGAVLRAPVGASSMVPAPTGPARSSLTDSRRNNGIPGMCGGGSMKKGGKR